MDNQYSNHMSRADFQGIIDLLLKAEGTLETITLSGGEPTSHPDFLDLVDMATRAEIGRVSVVTNGIRIARSREFCEQLKAKNVYVILQLDGFTARSWDVGDQSAELKGKLPPGYSLDKSGVPKRG